MEPSHRKPERKLLAGWWPTMARIVGGNANRRADIVAFAVLEMLAAEKGRRMDQASAKETFGSRPGIMSALLL